jgi:hypothetical protein
MINVPPIKWNGQPKIFEIIPQKIETTPNIMPPIKWNGCPKSIEVSPIK